MTRQARTSVGVIAASPTATDENPGARSRIALAKDVGSFRSADSCFGSGVSCGAFRTSARTAYDQTIAMNGTTPRRNIKASQECLRITLERRSVVKMGHRLQNAERWVAIPVAAV